MVCGFCFVLTVFFPFLPFLPRSFFFFLLSCSVILSFFHSKARSLRILAVSLIVYYFMARGWSWSKMSSGFQYNVTLGMLPVVMTLVLIDIFAKYFKTPGTMEKAMSKAAYVHNGHAALTLVLDRLPPASHLFFYFSFLHVCGFFFLCCFKSRRKQSSRWCLLLTLADARDAADVMYPNPLTLTSKGTRSSSSTRFFSRLHSGRTSLYSERSLTRTC